MNSTTLQRLYLDLGYKIEEAKNKKEVEKVITEFYNVLAGEIKTDLNSDLEKLFKSMSKKLGIDLIISAKNRKVLISTRTKSLSIFDRLKLNSKKLVHDITRKLKFDKQTITQRLKKEYNITKRIYVTGSHKIVERAKNFFAKKASKVIELNKEWVTRMINSRDAHIRLNGQIKKLDENFEIDGYTTDYPGNFGIAKMDINCYCKVRYVKVG